MISSHDELGRILIVEDEAIVAYDLADTLGAMGYTVLGIAESGEDAVAMARELAPDLVVMDIRLAGAIDGFEAATRIRSERDVAIIYLTAHSDRETTRRARRTDPFRYLVKPFKAPDLRSAIEIAQYKRMLEAELRRGLVDLSQLARGVACDLRTAEPGRAVAFDIERGITVNGDERLLRIALDRLIGHAWQLTSGIVEPTIQIGCIGSHATERVCFVRDNGADSNRQYAPNRFDDHGAELAIVQRIIHLHGGRIWGESSVGRGTIFYFAV
jgi:CheY-like chemotaxis protein